MKTKVCTKCKKEKSEIEFNRDTRNSTYGRRARCKPCENVYERERRKVFKNNNLEHTVKKEFEYNIRNKYDLTIDQWNKLFESQNGCCAICGKHQSNFVKRLGVEHNHKTYKIRSLVCGMCNHLIDICETNFYGHGNKIREYLEIHND